MTNLTLPALINLYTHHAQGIYGGEAVTQLEHALQCAQLARNDGADDALISAALLHDVGHLLDGDDALQPHERLAGRTLQQLFGRDVIEPIRLHVDAKRYLCTVDPTYHAGLSNASRLSLVRQGGPFSSVQTAEFIMQPHAVEAVRLRRWDDAAKVSGMPTPSLEHFLPALRGALLPSARASLQQVDHQPPQQPPQRASA